MEASSLLAIMNRGCKVRDYFMASLLPSYSSLVPVSTAAVVLATAT